MFIILKNILFSSVGKACRSGIVIGCLRESALVLGSEPGAGDLGCPDSFELLFEGIKGNVKQLELAFCSRISCLSGSSSLWIISIILRVSSSFSPSGFDAKSVPRVLIKKEKYLVHCSIKVFKCYVSLLKNEAGSSPAGI